MAERPFRILLVEDDLVQAKLAKAVLAASGFKEVAVAETAAAAIERAPQADLVLLDVQLPDGSGLDVLRRLRERSSRPAVVIVTGHGAEQIAVEALRLGADDYVSKATGFIDLRPAWSSGSGGSSACARPSKRRNRRPWSPNGGRRWAR